MTQLVPKEPTTGGEVAPLDLEHLFAFEAPEARMPEVERDGDARDPLRREPFVREPHMWDGADPSLA
jgi:hypothetical protein